MHVLMTADAVGGVWSYVLDLARALAAHDVRVTLAVMGPPPDDAQRAAAAAVPGLELQAGPYRLEWQHEPWADVERAGDWLLALASRTRPDLVQLNGYAHAALPWEVPVLVVAHSDVCSWWRAVHGAAAPPEWDRYRAAVRQGLAAADVVVAPTRAMLDALEREHGPVARGRVIHNACARAESSAAEREPLVLSAGRLWDEAKNLRTLAAAARDVPWPVLVAGDVRGPDGGEQPTPHVRWLGRLDPDALDGWMRRAAVFALPARYEPFGLTPVEAARAGCALVLGDLESLREVWGAAACFVPPDDPVALAGALRSLAADADRREALAARARSRARRYAPSVMGAAYAALYADCCAVAPARPAVPAHVQPA